MCDVGEVVEGGVETVEALAWLHLVAKRLGYRLLLENPSAALLDIVDLMGLTEHLSPTGDGSRAEED